MYALSKEQESFTKFTGLRFLRDSAVENLSFAALAVSIIVVCCKLSALWFHNIKEKISITHEDNIKERKQITRIQFLEKISYVLISLVGVAVIFLNIEPLEKMGTSILASAGVAGIVIGFAAQESVANLIAGFQLAFTQPVRIDDAVVIENEWGWVEEINFTYVIVRVWDRRRLVIPIRKLMQSPFQNWTRNGAQIIGSIELFLDFKTDMDKLRSAYEKIVKESPLWDGDVQVLQLIDATEKTIHVRGLATAKNSPTAWDLRCEVREKLINYLKLEQPWAFPQVRTESKVSQLPQL